MLEGVTLNGVWYSPGHDHQTVIRGSSKVILLEASSWNIWGECFGSGCCVDQEALSQGRVGGVLHYEHVHRLVCMLSSCIVCGLECDVGSIGSGIDYQKKSVLDAINDTVLLMVLELMMYERVDWFFCNTVVRCTCTWFITMCVKISSLRVWNQYAALGGNAVSVPLLYGHWSITK